MMAGPTLPKTGQKYSMPLRGKSPGLKRGRHNRPYWVARQVVRDPMGFPDSCIALPLDADEETLSSLCHEHTARLHHWIEQVLSEEPGDGTRTRYDGTVLSACRLYQEHPLSPFRTVKGNTRRYYAAQLGIIELSVGRRLIRRVTVLDVKRWYDEWRKPAPPPEDATPEQKAAWVRPERVDRAHDCVSMFRTVLHFCAALRHAECKELAAELKLVKVREGRRSRAGDDIRDGECIRSQGA